MCGIAGIIFKEDSAIDPQLIVNATAKIHRRGPDHQATSVHHQVHLGHRRLSILDTSEAAHQPMTDNSGNYTIIFNGEIFNFKSIKQALQNKGYVFQTTGDTEVLLNAYKEWKADCLQKLNGFFSFAIYDKLQNTVFIARDRMGIKPLSYYYDETYFAFTSELKALFALPIQKEINSLKNYQRYKTIKIK